MHIITFLFVCIEIVILFYLVIYKLARPDDNIASLDIWLVSLLLIYNITGGLLPDPNLPGSPFVQEVIAYATGFITPSFFPYYVYRAFSLKKMRFHVYRGVFLFLLLPFILFVIIYARTMKLETANDILLIPVLYAIWVIVSLVRSLKEKYAGKLTSYAAKEEGIGLILSLAPWIGLPIIIFFNLGQAVEVSVTNTGFLLLMGLHLKNHITQLRKEQERLKESEIRLVNWNTNLQQEVEKRTKELEKITEEKANTFVNLAHETKTPLTLIKNYLEEYTSKNSVSDELVIVKKSIDKLTTDITNLFDLERFSKGLVMFNHSQITSFSEILKDNLVLFENYSKKRNIRLENFIQENVFIKADPISINRIVNNLLENAIKFSTDEGYVRVHLFNEGNKITFSVADNGIGIPPELHKRVFEPYYQINHNKKSTQGMGLGLPIVKKVIEGLKGSIIIESNPNKAKGTKITVSVSGHQLKEQEGITPLTIAGSPLPDVEFLNFTETIHDNFKQTILIVEDNLAMVNYLVLKLKDSYNVYPAFNGNDALQKLKSNKVKTDLIISDIMMDKMDGFSLAKIISQDADTNHIPFLFLSARSSKSDKLHGLNLGAVDFIQKPFSMQELTKKINSILSNAAKQKKVVLSSALKALSSLEAGHLNDSETLFVDKFEKNCQLYNLTTREKDITKLIYQGYKYKMIADTLFIAERTVTKHVQNIFEKVNVSNKIELINKLTV